jgi:hypothetical protein
MAGPLGRFVTRVGATNGRHYRRCIPEDASDLKRQQNGRTISGRKASAKALDGERLWIGERLFARSNTAAYL